MIAVVIGATGLIGNLLIEKLLDDSEISKIISISRKTLPYSNQKIETLIVQDLSELKKYKEQLKGDIYFCCLGTTLKDAGSKSNFEKIDYEAVVEFAKIAENFAPKSFSLISAYGASPSSSIFYNQVKGRVENEIKKLKFNRLVILRPSLLIGNRKTFRFAEKVSIEIVKVLSFLLPNALNKRIGTSVDNLSAKLKDEGKKTIPGVFIFDAPEI